MIEIFGIIGFSLASFIGAILLGSSLRDRFDYEIVGPEFIKESLVGIITVTVPFVLGFLSFVEGLLLLKIMLIPFMLLILLGLMLLMGQSLCEAHRICDLHASFWNRAEKVRAVVTCILVGSAILLSIVGIVGVFI